MVSHKLMLRAGMIRQVTSGIYNWLPLGLRVLRNIENIIREEMNTAGALEILMPTIQPAELWHESGRYDAYGKEMLRIKDRHDRDMLYGPTHEEVVTDVFRQNVKSYRELPINMYQIQWKFRDEIRPRFGVMRGREFLMKDAYSFDLTYEGAKESYNNMYRAYLRTFARMGLSAVPVAADSGAIGGNLSHEFQVLAETGESQIFYDEKLDEVKKNPSAYDVEDIKSFYAASEEKHDAKNCPIPESRLRTARGIEVGHVFYLGTKYSKAMGAKLMGSDGAEVLMEMGCYGIGVSRLVAAVIESSHDDRGIIWPESIAPFRASLINLKPSDASCSRICEELYAKLQAKGVEVLYDDTESSAGAKFATHDLLGMPWQIVIGPKGAEKGVAELKNRASGEKQEISIEAVPQHIIG